MNVETETLQIARLIYSPNLGAHYHSFSNEILESLSNPNLQAIYELWLKPSSQNLKKKIDDLEEELLHLLGDNQKKIRLSSGQYCRLSTLPAIQTAERIRTLETKIATENPKESEQKFRTWLERAVIQFGAGAEPTNLSAKDPISLSLNHIARLHKYPLLNQPENEEITFPLASQKLEVKPKTPTGILPFDEIELEGGAEEDTILILSGESNVGKSHLGLYCLSSISLLRETVLLCSGEDSIETTRKRIFAHYLRRPLKEILEMTEKSRLTTMRHLYGHEEDPTSLHHHIVHNVALTCIPEGAFTPNKINEKIDIVEQRTQKKVKAVLCDYLQKMTENPESKKLRSMRDEELENIVNQIKETCQKRKTFCILVSQVPSHAAGGAQEFLNLKQAVARSYAATWGAHYIVTMNRPSNETKRLAAASEDKNPRINLFLCKNKDGPLGVCYALGLLTDARWEFYRNKADLDRELDFKRIERQTITQ